jgi:hypothetical protein
MRCVAKSQDVPPKEPESKGNNPTEDESRSMAIKE